MAVRTNAASDTVTRSANLPSATSFTFCGWSRITSDVGAALQIPFWLGDGSANGAAWCWDGTDNTGYLLYFSSGSSKYGAAFSSRPAVGSWFFWYVRCSGTSSGNLQGGWRSLTTAGWDSQVSSQIDAYTPTSVLLMTQFSSVYTDGRVAAVKGWDRVLTDDELLLESQYYRAIQRTSLR